MFNDVQLAKVSKINKTLEWANVPHQKQTPQTQISIYNFEKPSFVGDGLIRLSEDCLIPGNISTRYGTKEMELRSGKTLSSHFEESIEPAQKDNNESDNNISSCSTLDIVNKIEYLTPRELETHLKELSQRLQRAEKQRDELQEKLDECNEEKELCYRRLESIGSAHESRITEMHCVIAELSKKIRTRQETTILEENEPEGSDISYQEDSVCNSELSFANPNADDRRLSFSESNKDDNAASEHRKDVNKYNDSVAKSRVEVLQEEVLHLKAQVALLRSEIAGNLKPTTPEEEVDIKKYNVIGNAKADTVASAVSTQPNTSRLLCNQITICEPTHNTEIVQSNESKETTRCEVPVDNQQVMSLTKSAILVPKMAEKVKLSRTKKDGTLNSSQDPNGEVRVSTNRVGHFLDGVDLECELQRLHRLIEQYKMQNAMLSLALSECKEHCEELYLLCGKYESNAIALQSAVNCSDRAIEAYDVMLALLECKIALMAGAGAEAAEENRRSVESVARNLLIRLDSEKNMNENSLGPWKNTFGFTDKSTTPWTPEDDSRLRYHVSKLKGRRSTVQNTIVNLESPFSASCANTRLALEAFDSDALFNMKLSTEVHAPFSEPITGNQQLVATSGTVEADFKEGEVYWNRLRLPKECR